MQEPTTPPNESPTLAQVQEAVDRWITTTGGGYFSPLTNAVILAEETGEVARVMARKYGDQKAKPGDKSNLADELADLLWVVAAIANQTGIDLSQAFADNIAKKNTRDNQRFKSVFK
ncbi:nucleotide pyrophosphohydrolase [uncultured Duncaniella sp.]|uniref:nucleotide pyrophosphohydrolase n=1 Tax=uncultured Duncaniella sp. TaxID=2768039 RepID=UPI0025ED5076|nr:nucleotide pyrophosphohydrolase [uncultured Duncaniella sp.]